METQKIKHPYHIPDDFFEKFKEETRQELDKNYDPPKSTLRRIELTFLKYAAIIILSFLLGRKSMQLFSPSDELAIAVDEFTVDEVYNQVSEDEITDFIINDAPENILNDKNN